MKVEIERSYLYYGRMKIRKDYPEVYKYIAVDLGVTAPRGPKVIAEVTSKNLEGLVVALKASREYYIEKGRTRRSQRIRVLIMMIHRGMSVGAKEIDTSALPAPKITYTPEQEEAKVELENYVAEEAERVISYLEKEGLLDGWFRENFQQSIRVSPKSYTSRGGVRYSKPFISLALHHRHEAFAGIPGADGFWTFLEYPTFREDPEIGTFQGKTWNEVVTVLILHEMSHALHWYYVSLCKNKPVMDAVKRKFGELDERPHGDSFQNIYRNLRRVSAAGALTVVTPLKKVGT